MRWLNWVMALLTAALVAACGGGGGSSGTPVLGNGSGSGTGGTTGGTTASYVTTVSVQRSGTATTQISSTETVQAVATVKTSAGAAVEGVVVTFSETAGSLLIFAPSSATALTDSNGQASIDVSAATPTSTGATTVQASAAIGSSTAAGSQSIAIAATQSTGTPPTPAAINFVGVTPSGTAIVIKGAGGNGRSESAILTFKIVDASGAPINAAKVDFTLNSDNGGATLSQASGLSNSDGTVTASVQSGADPASIVVRATADTAPTVTAQSDTLIVSNSVPVAGGFELVSNKYSLDGRLTGDSATLTAFVRDQFGNPVPDGVAVSVQTDYGVVASSTLGGCTTINGQCTVTFRVQNPRGDGIATVVGTVRVGSSTTLTTSLQINMAGSTANYQAENTDGTIPTVLTMTSCKQSFELLLSDGSDGNGGLGRAAAAGTTIAAPFASTGVVATVSTGSPVLDVRGGGFPPTSFGFQIDLTNTTSPPTPACKTGGVVKPSTNYVRFEYTTPGSQTVFPQRIYLNYPQ